MVKYFIPMVLLVGLALAMPAKEAIDKATEDDIAINDVIPEKPAVSSEVENLNDNSKERQIEATTPKESETTSEESDTTATTAKPPESAGAAIARIIDDIFQIPITVLQSVAKLLTSPFLAVAPKPPVAA